MHFSPLPLLYEVHSLQLSFNEDSSLLLLGKPPGNFGTNYYARNQLLAKNSISNTQRTTQKLPAPQQGCSAAHRGSEGTSDSSIALLMIADRDAFLTTSVMLPSQLSARLSSRRLQYFPMHIKSP